MTWPAFALFLARRTESAFNIGHFLIFLPFHSLFATFQVSISLIFYLFWSHCFGWNISKVVKGSKFRNTFMHGPSFFSFDFLSFSISFPKFTIFTSFTSLHDLQDVENHCAHLRDIELHTSKKIPYLHFPHVLFSMKLDWRVWNYKTKKKNSLRIQKKGHKNKHKKTWMKWNDTKWTIWYFQQCACVNAIYFASVVTTTHCLKNNQSSTRGPSLEMSLC